MKKTHKRILGLVGLGIVVATTAFAVSLPAPEASATETSTVTDTISVRVVGSDPSAVITSSVDTLNITSRAVSSDVTYENIENLVVTVTRTGE